MNPIVDGLVRAFWLLVSFDPEVYSIMLLSLAVSGGAVLIGAVTGVPFGAFIALRSFVGKRILLGVLNTLNGMPPVVVGLLVYLLLSSSGPLGPLQLLYTPQAMLIAQLVMVFPIVASVTASAITAVDRRLRLRALSLGADEFQVALTMLKEARTGVFTAMVLAFGAAVSEVGAVMIVGGNIRWFTRTLTTAILLETELGHFGVALALGIILLALSFAVNMVLTHLQWSGLRR
jgi:tungstate transport system permease protein